MTQPFDPSQVSQRWADWRASVDLDEYDQRWVRLEQSGTSAHGEADLVERVLADCGGGAVLDAGCGMGRVAIELARRGIDVEGADLDPDLLAYARSHAPELVWHHADLATMQLPRRFRVVAMPGNVMIFCRPEHRRPIVHTVSRHLEPGGAVVAGFALEAGHQALTLDDYDALCADSGLTLVARYATWEGAPYEGGPYAVSVHRRPAVPADHDHLDV